MAIAENGERRRETVGASVSYAQVGFLPSEQVSLLAGLFSKERASKETQRLLHLVLFARFSLHKLRHRNGW